MSKGAPINGGAFLLLGVGASTVVMKKSKVGEAWDSRLWHALPSVQPFSRKPPRWERVAQRRKRVFGR